MTTPLIEITDDATYTFPEWRPLPHADKAVCRQPSQTRKPDDWFPTTNAGITEAKMNCFWCPLGMNGGEPGPLSGSCLEYAMDMEGSTVHREGIWGGATPEDRIRMYAGEMTEADLYGVCAASDCEEPMPTAFNRTYCHVNCVAREGQRRRRAAKKEGVAA